MEPEVQKAGTGGPIEPTSVLAGQTDDVGETSTSPQLTVTQQPQSQPPDEPNADAAAEVLRQISINDSALEKKKAGRKRTGKVEKDIKRQNLSEGFSPAELPPLKNTSRSLNHQLQWNQSKPTDDCDTTPPLMRRIRMTQKGIRDRSKPTPEEEFWSGKVHRPFNLCSDVYVLPAPSPVRGVEACIATLAPSAPEGKVPKSLQNLINFAKLGMLPNDTVAKTSEAEKILNDNMKRQTKQRPVGTPLPDTIESCRAISVSELIQQARQQESTKGVVSTKKSKPVASFAFPSHAGNRIAMNPNLSSICKQQYALSKVALRVPRVAPSLPVFELPSPLYIETPRHY